MKSFYGILLLLSSTFSSELVNPVQVIGLSLGDPGLNTKAMKILSEKMNAIEEANGIYLIREGLSSTKFYHAVDHIRMDSGKGLVALDSGSYGRWVFQKPGSIHFYWVEGGQDNRMSNFLTFAYMHEAGIFHYDEKRFKRIEPKSHPEFWKRNLISQGWGAQYIYKDNPYVSHGWAPIGFGYFWDAFCYFAILGGPFIGKHATDKVAIPIVGLVGALIFRVGFNGLIVGRDLDIYNRVANSGYPVPKYDGWGVGKLYADLPKDTLPEKEIP